MIIQRRLIPHLAQIFRSKHNLISFLKNPKRAVKNARAAETKLNLSFVESMDDGFISKFPKRITRTSQVNSLDAHHLYLVNDETATKIARHLTESVDPSKTFVETNPGLGLLTKLLVQSDITDLRLFEAHSEFSDDLQRSLYVDQLTGGNRIDRTLSGLPSTEWENDTNFTLFGATGSSSFFWHLINSIVYQNSILALGRCEMYMVMPSLTYMTLAGSNSSALQYYRSLSILFQIFFEYQLLDKFPRADFLPHLKNPPRVGKLNFRLRNNVKGIQLATVDPELMYFVKIVPRSDLYECCPPKQIQELWHFICLHCFARQNRIIPLLEKWIPGCGARLLIDFCTKERKRPQRIHKFDLFEPPPSTNRSMTLSDRDYYDNLNIYTQFGDLQPTQLLTLFREFHAMPEYASCSFVASLERVLQKKTVIKSDESSGSSASIKQARDVR
ncbi:dimethyladenosine transferase 2, mitochondrial isoform X2 [Bradysia coprophila]|uniref:dimethyladenosine transferase 2, mitochondrial isoform X2 n=1 Tax=Bradysia coprophila TaxID=38358 RepID=UPI00187DB4DB|nr:dimethyladenosine transferase 2, mitochondrial isoform X2 [Bradysia coprophila]